MGDCPYWQPAIAVIIVNLLLMYTNSLCNAGSASRLSLFLIAIPRLPVDPGQMAAEWQEHHRWGYNDVIRKYYLCSVLPPSCCGYILRYVKVVN